MPGKYKRLDSLLCYKEKKGYKCYVKSGLVTKGIDNVDHIQFSDVGDVRAEDGMIEVVLTKQDLEYRVNDYAQRYLSVRKKK